MLQFILSKKSPLLETKEFSCEKWFSFSSTFTHEFGHGYHMAMGLDLKWLEIKYGSMEAIENNQEENEW